MSTEEDLQQVVIAWRDLQPHSVSHGQVLVIKHDPGLEFNHHCKVCTFIELMTRLVSEGESLVD